MKSEACQDWECKTHRCGHSAACPSVFLHARTYMHPVVSPHFANWCLNSNRYTRDIFRLGKIWSEFDTMGSSSFWRQGTIVRFLTRWWLASFRFRLTMRKRLHLLQGEPLHSWAWPLSVSRKREVTILERWVLLFQTQQHLWSQPITSRLKRNITFLLCGYRKRGSRSLRYLAKLTSQSERTGRSAKWAWRDSPVHTDPNRHVCSCDRWTLRDSQSVSLGEGRCTRLREYILRKVNFHGAPKIEIFFILILF